MAWTEYFGFGGNKAEEKKEEEPPMFDWTQESLNEYLKKQDASIPPVSVEFMLSSHRTGYDARHLKRKIPEADIFIPELYGWTENTRKRFRGISAGTGYPGDTGHDFLDAEEEALSDTKKAVTFIDFPLSIRKKIDEKRDEMEAALGYEGTDLSSYEKMLESRKKEFQLGAWFMDEFRETYMLKHLGPEIVKVLREYPELKKKENLKVLLQLGGAHSKIYHDLKKSGTDVSREYSRMPFVFPHADEGIRAFRLGKTPSDETTARAFLEESLENTLDHKVMMLQTEDSEDLCRYIRFVAGEFSEGEIRDMFDAAKNSGKEFYGVFDEEIEKKLREKGLTLPGSSEELSEFLTQHDPWQQRMK